MREFRVMSDGYELRGWLREPADGLGLFPCVLLCHGIPSGQPAESGDYGYPALMERIAGRGLACIYFNFRGTGDSQGDFSFGGWLRDLERVVDAVLNGRSPFGDIDMGRLAILAFSGGAAVSIDFAARHHHFQAIASMASPADLVELIPRENLAEILAHWKGIGLIRDPGFPPDAEQFHLEVEELSPLRHVAWVAPTPLLIVHGELDDLVPLHAARQLFEAAEEPKELRILPGAGHKLRLAPEAVAGALDWLQARLG